MPKLKYATIDQVKNCILKHRYSRSYQLNTIEEKIIQDADNFTLKLPKKLPNHG
ncbi:MAG: hypothetical protein ABIJ43_06015 [Candidatus Beckwithbacteria bacterium]|nr:hypothetical protein [Patescibacteria group bacterium]